MKLKVSKINILLCLTLFLSCKNSYQVNNNDITLSRDMLNKWNTKKFIVVFPCTRCSCFLAVLNNIKGLDSTFIANETTLITDSSCNKTKFKFNHREQKQIDSLSDDIYNITLIKKNEIGVKIRIINTTESDQTVKIFRTFFGY